MTTVNDIIAFVERSTGRPLSKDEGVHRGSRDAGATSVTVAWMATADALRAAGASGSDLFIGHECLYFPYDVHIRGNGPDGWEDWPTNAQRNALLDEHGMTFLRVHSSMDQMTILDDFAALLELGEPVFVDGFVRIYEIAECAYGELVDRVKRRTGMPHVRITMADRADRTVRRVGVPWGGLGLFTNVSFQQQILEQGVDVMIAGETDNYGFRFGEELGVPMIETSHEISENPGIERFAKLLGEEFPGLTVTYHDLPCVWSWK